MAKNYSRVKRGMVFWFDPSKCYGESINYKNSKGNTYQSSLQTLNRPWLVVSNDTNNINSPTCNIVPITLEDKNVLPVHVLFNFEGKRQTIMIEQLRTVDIMALTDYMYTVSDEIMEKVEKAMVVQFGIRESVKYSDFTLQNTLDQLEHMIGSIIEEKVKEANKSEIPMSQVEDTAIKLGQMIEDLIKPSSNCSPTVESKPEEQETKPSEVVAKEPAIENSPEKPHRDISPKNRSYVGLSPVEKFNKKYQTEESKVDKKPVESDTVSRKTLKRNTWTLETRQEYLKDCNTMSSREVMKKYGFSNIQSVFQTKYACKVALEKAGVSVQ